MNPNLHEDRAFLQSQLQQLVKDYAKSFGIWNLGSDLVVAVREAGHAHNLNGAVTILKDGIKIAEERAA